MGHWAVTVRMSTPVGWERLEVLREITEDLQKVVLTKTLKLFWPNTELQNTNDRLLYLPVITNGIFVVINLIMSANYAIPIFLTFGRDKLVISSYHHPSRCGYLLPNGLRGEGSTGGPWPSARDHRRRGRRYRAKVGERRRDVSAGQHGFTAGIT